MKDPRIEKLADILVNYSTRVGKGDIVVIDFSGVRCLPLVEAIYEECLKKRARSVEYHFASEDLARKFYELADDAQLSYFPRHRLDAMKKANVYIGIGATENTQNFAGVEMAKMVRRQQVLRPISDRRVDHTRWVVTRYPTFGLAQDACMSLEAFEDFYFRACNIDWPDFAKKITRLWRMVGGAREIRIVSSDTDLRFSKKGIPAVKSEGLRNMPDGEVYTAPVKDSVEGYITYNVPSFYHGKEFDGVRLEFKKGRIAGASCRAGSETELRKILDADAGARYIGEFAFGLNKNIDTPMKNILFDEKICGSIHFTPGQAYKIADNGNRSSIHWDLVKILKGDGEVYLDGRLVQKNGKFVVRELKGLN
ncbi:MAG: aminopeptidase [Candidatus Omnitrophica bacterium]|nr:aminopeptidase [Candidatus Omnitrophota bacterium]MDD5574677.1 aminopeptidase [Candidatus Omnitrophota bacterium]